MFSTIKMRQFRDKLRLSQQEVAQHIGVSQSTYSDWESNNVQPHSKFYTKIAEILQTEIANLLEDNSFVQIIYNQENKDRSVGSVSMLIEKEEDKSLQLRLENTEASLKVALKYIEKLEAEIANYNKKID